MDGTDCGYFGAYIGCSPEKAQTALRMLREEFQKIASVKIFDVELDRAKKYLIGRHDIELQRNSAICSSLLFDEIYGLPYDETFRFAEKINAVTSSDVLTIAQRIFSQNEVISVVGPISPFT
jgi:zinc protease